MATLGAHPECNACAPLLCLPVTPRALEWQGTTAETLVPCPSCVIHLPAPPLQPQPRRCIVRQHVRLGSTHRPSLQYPGPTIRPDTASASASIHAPTLRTHTRTRLQESHNALTPASMNRLLSIALNPASMNRLLSIAVIQARPVSIPALRTASSTASTVRGRPCRASRR